MALPLESKIMDEIGLGNNYRWYNGSGSCGYIARDAVDRLESVAGRYGLQISSEWMLNVQQALNKDTQYSLTNTWVACSYAIADAIHRKERNRK